LKAEEKKNTRIEREDESEEVRRGEGRAEKRRESRGGRRKGKLRKREGEKRERNGKRRKRRWRKGKGSSNQERPQNFG